MDVIFLLFGCERDLRLTLVCLNWSRVLLRLRRVNWSTYWCTIAVNISHGEARQQEGEDLGYRGYR